MVQTSTDSVMYEPLKANLKAYQRILKNSINEAKRVYHHNLFARYKSDITKTWSIINNNNNISLLQTHGPYTYKKNVKHI